MFLGLFCQALSCLSLREFRSSYNWSFHLVPSSHLEFLPGHVSFQEAKIFADLMRKAGQTAFFLFLQVRQAVPERQNDLPDVPKPVRGQSSDPD